MNEINRFPITQMKILIRFWDSPDKMGFAEGRDEGGSVKELFKNGFIEPAGKVGRRIRWRLVKGALTNDDVAAMRDLVMVKNSNYNIVREVPFSVVPNSFDVVASLVTESRGSYRGFAFKVDFFDCVGKKHMVNSLFEIAKKVVDEYMCENSASTQGHEEHTFEYDGSQFVEVDNPKWWNKSGNKGGD